MTLSVWTFDAECCYAEWSRYVTVILSAVMLNAVMLSAVMLSVIMIPFIILSVIFSLCLFWLTLPHHYKTFYFLN